MTMKLDFEDDPNLVPRPRDEIQIVELRAMPYPDGKRVRVEIVTTAFSPADRPSLDVVIESPERGVLSATSIIETTQRAVALTMHLKQNATAEEVYILRANLFFEAGVTQHSMECRFSP